MSGNRLFPLLFLAFLACTSAPAQSSTTPDILDVIYPVDFHDLDGDGTTELVVSSPFGPRLQASEGYIADFHRGIDLPGDTNDPIYAVADGTIYKAYTDPNSTYPDGGNVVIIRHDLDTPVTFHGITVTQVYSLYLHLNGFGTAAQDYLNSGATDSVNQGDVIGYMGASGDTDFTHLHFEMRYQTTCSLEYQLENPTTNCADYGFDPHVNPMGFYLSNVDTDHYSIAINSITDTEAQIAITANRNFLNVDGVKVGIYNAAGTTLLYEDTISFNDRTSFDATSTAALDSTSLSGDYLNFEISAGVFNAHIDGTSYEVPEYTFNVTTQIPSDVWETNFAISVTATLLTTEGESISATENYFKIPSTLTRRPFIPPSEELTVHRR